MWMVSSQASANFGHAVMGSSVQAESSLRVLQCGRRFGIRPEIRHAVVHKNAGNANRVEPIAYFGALKVDRQDVISTSRKDDHSGARIFALGFVDRERWNRYVPKADQ